ncbi:hypothetical protein ACWCQQ_22365 [Streptomyces sp. NPDC002143]
MPSSGSVNRRRTLLFLPALLFWESMSTSLREIRQGLWGGRLRAPSERTLREPRCSGGRQADRFLAKKSASLATAGMTYSSLSYRSTWVAPSMTKNSFGSPAFATASRLK